MNKYFKITFLVLISLSNVCYSQSNQDVLDRLDEIQMERELDKITRDIQRRNEQNRIQPPTSSNNPESYRKDINQPYVNIMTDLEIRDVSKFLNLSISEYLRRDEISEIFCKNVTLWRDCYYSKMMNISMREFQMRDSKIKEKCMNITNESSQQKCMRDIFVFGK